MLIHSSNQEFWRGERINGVAHPLNIEKLWSVAELAAIGLEKFVAPPAPPVDPLTRPLNSMQFEAMLRSTGHYDAVKTVVNGLPENQKHIVLAKLNRQNSYNRVDALVVQLGAALGLTSDDVDALWLQAWEIK
ncbi:MAG: hypothetical protein GY742_11295 [Hyphomicrobiales bacterium]|nr:hypothetical protein [Hyphomicrobiales bacterium]